MTAGPPLVYLSLKLKGLEETLGLREDQILRVGDEPGAEERARVRVLVAAGAIHLPIELVESFPNLAVIVSIAAGHDGIDLDHARARGIVRQRL